MDTCNTRGNTGALPVEGLEILDCNTTRLYSLAVQGRKVREKRTVVAANHLYDEDRSAENVHFYI